jgi:hypothetical protein
MKGRLDPEGGSLLRKALEATSGPRAREDGRTPAQRRCSGGEPAAGLTVSGIRMGWVGADG